LSSAGNGDSDKLGQRCLASRFLLLLAISFIYNWGALPKGQSRTRQRRTHLGTPVEQISTRLRDVLVPVDGTKASTEAVALACATAKRNKGRVYVVYVIEVPRALALDADLSPEVTRGEEILVLAEQRAQAEDFQVKGELLQARDAGHAIVDEAIERAVDGVILAVAAPQRPMGEGGFAWPRGGKPSPSRPPGEFKLGHVAQYVLENAPCQVWLLRLPAVG